MTLADIKNQGLYHWFTLGLRKSNLFIYPFGADDFREFDAVDMIKFIRR